MNLSWSDNSSNETGFEIERAQGSGPYVQIFVSGANVTSYQDKSVAPATTYSYRIRARNGATSPYSNTATATTRFEAPAAPSNLSAVAISNRQINLSWKDNSNNELGFQIERATGSGAFVQIKVTGANVTSYQDSSVAAGTTYTYRIRAGNGADSGYSSTVSATTLK